MEFYVYCYDETDARMQMYQISADNNARASEIAKERFFIEFPGHKVEKTYVFDKEVVKTNG